MNLNLNFFPLRLQIPQIRYCIFKRLVICTNLITCTNLIIASRLFRAKIKCSCASYLLSTPKIPPTQATTSPGNPACFWSQGGSIPTAPTSVPSTSTSWFSALSVFNAVVTQAIGRWTCAIWKQHHRRLLASTVGSEERLCAWQYDVASNGKTLIPSQSKSRLLATVPGTYFLIGSPPDGPRSRPRRSGQVLHLT